MGSKKPEKRPPHAVRLIALREAKGLSQSDVARALGLPNPSPYAAIEQGRTKNLMPEKAKQLAAILDTTVEFLFTGKHVRGEQTANMRYLPLGGDVGARGVVDPNAHLPRPGRVRGIRFVGHFPDGKVAYTTSGPWDETGFETGTALICADQTDVAEDLIGRTAVVCVGPDDIRLGKVSPGGKPGTYNLSRLGRVIDRDVTILWGQRVVGTKLPGEWEHSSRDRKSSSLDEVEEAEVVE